MANTQSDILEKEYLKKTGEVLLELQNVKKYFPINEKAAELLDEAGYVDVDGDGYRETPDGEEWVVNLNYPTGNQLRENSAPILAQMIEEAGIQVDLRQPKEMSAFVEDLTDNTEDWDLYLIGWSLGSGDPDMENRRCL